MASAAPAVATDIDDAPAWLTTVVTRICLDQLRQQTTRSHFEAQLTFTPSPTDPETDAVLAEQVGGAMQAVLDTLVPAERAAFVLHDVFGYGFDDISAILGRSDTAVRQLASRARRKLHGLPETTAQAESRSVVEAFLAAARGDDIRQLAGAVGARLSIRSCLIKF